MTAIYVREVYMNSFLNKMERKFGRYAISNLSLYIIIAYAIGYVLMFTGSLDFITLNPFYIFQRIQVWRVVTWILVPPAGFSIFTVIMLYFYYSIGNVLERTWGAFRYNVYIFSGILFTVVGAVVLYLIAVGNGADPIATGYSISRSFSTYYINLSIMLAFAATYPDAQVLLFFVIPIKMKWMGYFEAAYLLYEIIYCRSISVTVAIVMSLLNFILFFVTTRNYRSISPKEIYRKQKFKQAVNSGGASTGSFTGFASKSSPAGISKHKCAICGRTEKDNDSLEFRFCSKCNGNYEYCSDHLFTHEHKK